MTTTEKGQEKKTSILKQKIRNFALTEADKIGFAPIENLWEYGFPSPKRPQDILPGAKSIITFFIRGIEMPRHTMVVPGTRLSVGYAEWTANFILLGAGYPGSAHVDLIAYKIARFIMKNGYSAIPIPSGHPYDNVNHRGIISHKLAAVECGIGEMGLHTLLITPEFGCSGWLASVLTDAPFEYDKKFSKPLCENERGKCKLACIKNCPVGAISEEGIVDKDKCANFNREEIGPAAGYPSRIYLIRCGICMGSCPIGKKFI